MLAGRWQNVNDVFDLISQKKCLFFHYPPTDFLSCLITVTYSARSWRSAQNHSLVRLCDSNYGTTWRFQRKRKNVHCVVFLHTFIQTFIIAADIWVASLFGGFGQCLVREMHGRHTFITDIWIHSLFASTNRKKNKLSKCKQPVTGLLLDFLHG